MKRLFYDIAKASNYKPSSSFVTIFESIEGKTMLTRNKLKALYEFAIMAKVLDGDVVDAGVWEGGSTYLLASVLSDKTVHSFDSWNGLPKLTEADYLELEEHPMPEGWGTCNPPVELLSKFDDRVVLHKGWFKDTFDSVSDKQFCLVHIDCDRYQSAKECLDFFYPKMVANGIMILDDYAFHLTPGVTKAVDEFFEGRLEEIKYYTHPGLYLIVINKGI